MRSDIIHKTSESIKWNQLRPKRIRFHAISVRDDSNVFVPL